MRSLLLPFFLLVTFIANSQTSQPPKATEQQADCSQRQACEKPVKWLTDKQDCSCFACEYGKPGRQHTVCTSNKDAKLNLMKLSETDGDQLASAPIKEFTGKVVLRGNAAILTDKNGKKWDILNPDFLKDYSGQFVDLQVKADEQNKWIRVMGIADVKDKTKAPI
jgi:hypothetical protein